MKIANELRYFTALKVISGYQTVEQLRRNSERDWGLSFEEALEMAYDNVIFEAKQAIKGRRPPGPATGNAQTSGRDPLNLVPGENSSDPKEEKSHE